MSPFGLWRWRWFGGHGGWLRRTAIFLGDEAIAFAGHGLDEAGMVGIVFQSLANFADGGIDAVLGVDEDFFAPEAVDDFLAGNDVAVFFREQEEQFHGDAFEFQDAAVAPQLEAGAVELKFSEFVLRLRHAAPKLRHKTIALPEPAWVRAFGVNWLRLQVSSPNLYLAVLVISGHPRQDAIRRFGSERFSSDELY